jgi:hypothetical protein
VSTEIFEEMPEAAATSAVTFTDSPRGTTLVILGQHKNQANRDLQLRSGRGCGRPAGAGRVSGRPLWRSSTGCGFPARPAGQPGGHGGKADQRPEPPPHPGEGAQRRSAMLCPCMKNSR